MTTPDNNFQTVSDDDLPLSRELIVIAKPEAQLRATGPSVVSKAGVDTNSLNELLSSENATLELLFGTNEDRLEQEVATSAATTEDSAMNSSVYYCVQADDEKLDNLATRLLEQDTIEAAYVKPAAELAVMTIERSQTQQPDVSINAMSPLADEAPPVTPNFVSRQGYLNAAPTGIDMAYAKTFRGGTGTDINIIDLEWGWNFSHEDLRARQGGVVGGTNSKNNDHGTAVIGEIGGDRNNFGITGICPDANVSAVAFSMPTATAIRLAADRLRRGDIMLLEIHRAGPRFNFQGRQDQQGYIAVEWWPDDFAAIRYAVAKGIIVVEAAGNGRQNFDDPLYNQRPNGFPTSWRNPLNPANLSSGAVVVGAGAPPPGTHGRNHGPDRSRLGFSNYGARVDAQGWGREVTTTGYGDLQGGSNANTWYTDQFSGTSSSAPIITGALGCVQGILKAANLPLLTSSQAIRLLRRTGSPQQDAPTRPRTERIGNRPNLRQLIPQALSLTPGNYSGVWLPKSGGYYLWANASWSSFRTKWQELAGKGRWLFLSKVHRAGNNTRYSGVWLPGSGGYYLWANASWSSFRAKWQELADKGLRLVDLEVHRVGNSNRYSGVWLPGSGGYYLWVNANWHSFKAKWQELAKNGLKLVDIEVNGSGSAPSFDATASELMSGFGGDNMRDNTLTEDDIENTNGFGGGDFSDVPEETEVTNGFGGGDFLLEIDETAPDITDGFGGGDMSDISDTAEPNNGFGGGDMVATIETVAVESSDGFGGGDMVADLEESAPEGFGGGNVDSLS